MTRLRLSFRTFIRGADLFGAVVVLVRPSLYRKAPPTTANP